MANEAILMNTHNICFYGESSNTLLICSSGIRCTKTSYQNNILHQKQNDPCTQDPSSLIRVFTVHGPKCDSGEEQSESLLGQRSLCWFCCTLAQNIECLRTRNCMIYEPHHQKTCLRGLPPGKTQTTLLSYRS